MNKPVSPSFESWYRNTWDPGLVTSLDSLLETRVLGETVGGHSIHLYECGSGSDVRLLIGGFHGSEQPGALLAYNFAKYLDAGAACGDQYKILVIPFLNPDGLIVGERRNANQVDLNRNFPTENWAPESRAERFHPGPEPASEIETRIMIDLLETYSPTLIVSIHTPLHMVNYDGPAEALAEEMGRLTGYEVSASIGYPTPGSFGTYAGVERQIPTITLELPRAPFDEIWEDNRQALEVALTYPM